MSNVSTGVDGLLDMLPDKKRRLSVDEKACLLWPVLELCRARETPVLSHTGCVAYSDTSGPRAIDPIPIDGIVIASPDPRLIVGHAGVRTAWYTSSLKHAPMAAARHPSVPSR